MLTESNTKLGILHIRRANKDNTSYQTTTRCTREVQRLITELNTVLMRLKLNDEVWHSTRCLYVTSGGRRINVNVNYFIVYY